MKIGNTWQHFDNRNDALISKNYQGISAEISQIASQFSEAMYIPKLTMIFWKLQRTGI